MKQESKVRIARAAAVSLVLVAAMSLTAPGWGQEPDKEKDQTKAQEQTLEKEQGKRKEQKQARQRDRKRVQDVRGPAARVVKMIGRELHLSREQRQSLRELVKQHSADLRGAARDFGAARLALREQSLADTFDEAAIRGASERLGATIGAASVLAARVAGEVRPPLTPEQRNRLRKLSTRWDERRVRWLKRMERWDGN